jgi:hypothetical protein
VEQQIASMFNELGARARVSHREQPPEFVYLAGKRRKAAWAPVNDNFRVDVQHDNFGEFFDLRCGADVQIEIPDCVADDRHLLLVAYRGGWGPTGTYLCGRDERSWFVAAIPETANARDVQSAKDALKPPEVWDAMRKFQVPMERRDQRRTAAFVRQGEWFFIPCPGMTVVGSPVLRNEPIRRGVGKAHMCQFLHQVKGTPVWVNESYPNGLTRQEIDQLSDVEKEMSWQRMMRGAQVFVRGAIRHPDHKTIHLAIWHQVVMNTETQARAMQHMAFLD